MNQIDSSIIHNSKFFMTNNSNLGGIIKSCLNSKKFRLLLIAIFAIVFVIMSLSIRSLENCNEEMCGLIPLEAALVSEIVFIPIIMISILSMLKRRQKSLLTIISLMIVTIIFILFMIILSIIPYLH